MNACVIFWVVSLNFLVAAELLVTFFLSFSCLGVMVSGYFTVDGRCFCWAASAAFSLVAVSSLLMACGASTLAGFAFSVFFTGVVVFDTR